MEKKTRKRTLKLIVKVLLTILAVYVVVNRIDIRETGRILFQAGILWLLPALIILNLSKIISAFRLERFYRVIGLKLQLWYNIRLYYVGMFYNLFLPGGIGGDGYKVYLLHRYFQTPVRWLVSATLLDRVSGMVALCSLALFFGLFIDLPVPGSWIHWLIALLLVLAYPVYYLIIRILFRRFITVFHITNIGSLGVQGLQVLAALFILWSLGIDQLYLEYLVLFLLSSIIAVLPFTIGGFGARELVFIFGAEYLMINTSQAVAFSLLFFLLMAISAFAGVFLETRVKKEKGNQN